MNGMGLVNQSRRRGGRAALAALAAVVLIGFAGTLPGHGAQGDSLSDAEFWSAFASMSETGGTFASENFVSNEVTFQEVIPSVQRAITPNGVYVGVGPEQNFTYIANLKPRMAFIVDIRRQNAMQHLMFKALFELSPTRAEFASRLFSRPFTLRDPAASAAVIFDSVQAVQPDGDAYRANFAAITDRLTKERGFALSPDDLETMRHVYQVFFEAGPAVNYGYRPGYAATLFRSRYPTFGDLQSATNADSVPMAFLATEENYRTIRDMQLQNRIVPVVGDFGGPKALRAVGDFLYQRGLTVTTFYLSNVEQYLFRERGKADLFYGNVASMPTDSTSVFIRSVPPGGGGSFISFGSGGTAMPLGGGTSFSITIRDSAGVRVIQTMQDSGGQVIRRSMVDSAGLRPLRTPDSLVRIDSIVPRFQRDTMIFSRDSAVFSILQNFSTFFRDSGVVRPVIPMAPGATSSQRMMVGGSLLSSGTASIRETIRRSLAGELLSYNDVIGMTKTTGWK